MKILEYKNNELFLTKITRPVSFWVVLISFLVLLFLNSFGIVKTDPLYLKILKQVLITMTAFYFTARTVDKIAEAKYNNSNINSSMNSNINSKEIP